MHLWNEFEWMGTDRERGGMLCRACKESNDLASVLFCLVFTNNPKWREKREGLCHGWL